MQLKQSPCYFYPTYSQPRNRQLYPSEFRAERAALPSLPESPEASLQGGCSWSQKQTDPGKLFSVNSPGDVDEMVKVKVTDFPGLQPHPFISKTLRLRGTLLNESLLATFVPQKILGRETALILAPVLQ